MTQSWDQAETTRDELRRRYATFNLTASITISSQPVGCGAFSDVHSGQWQKTPAATPETVHSSSSAADKCLTFFPGAQVAVKVLRLSYTSSLPKVHIDMLQCIRREISVWRRLPPHPNIHRFLGLVWLEDRVLPAMVSAWHENGNLVQYLDKVARSPHESHNYAIQLKLLTDVALGLAHLHTNGVIHADIKGENVLVSLDGDALLCAFGLSWTSREGSVAFGLPHNLGGTNRFLAPELCQLDDCEDAPIVYTDRSDIWAFGCLSLEAFSGEKPYSEICRDPMVIVALSQGRLFKRPQNLGDPAWEFVLLCCTVEAKRRPDARTILVKLHSLQSVEQPRVNSISASQPSSRTSPVPSILPESTVVHAQSPGTSTLDDAICRPPVPALDPPPAPSAAPITSPAPSSPSQSAVDRRLASSPTHAYRAEHGPQVTSGPEVEDALFPDAGEMEFVHVGEQVSGDEGGVTTGKRKRDHDSECTNKKARHF